MSRTKDKSRSKDLAVVLALIAFATPVAVELIRWLASIHAVQSQAADHSAPLPSPTAMLRIASLSPGGQVAFDPIVDGDALGQIEQVWLFIQTRETPPKCWLQGPAGLDEDLTWHIPAQFGRSQ